MTGRRPNSIEWRLLTVLSIFCFIVGPAFLAWPAVRVVATGYAAGEAQAKALAAWERPAAGVTPGDTLVLEIPRFGLRRFVPNGATVEHLRQYGVGHISWTSFPPSTGADIPTAQRPFASSLSAKPLAAPSALRGTVVAIAGHRTTYGAPFFRIGDLVRGDAITLRYAGRRYTYAVDHLVRARPDDTGVLDGDAHQLALVTCSPPYSAAFRLIVFGSLKGVAPAP